MPNDVIQTPQAPAPVGPYNQAIRATGTMVFCSGQIALNPATGEIVGQGDVAQQTVQVMQNLEAVLKAAGATWADVVKTTVFLADMNDFATVNSVYARYFDEAIAPARACVEVARLPKDVQVEVDCIAVVG
jgi:2-iminobutanoate/2-iminopropanoate deaminase